MGPAEHQGKEVHASAQHARREHTLNKQTVRSDRAPVRKKPNNAYTHLPRRSTVLAPAAPTSLRGLPVCVGQRQAPDTPLWVGKSPWSATQAAGTPGRTAGVLTARRRRAGPGPTPAPPAETQAQGTQAGAGAQACD